MGVFGKIYHYHYNFDYNFHLMNIYRCRSRRIPLMNDRKIRISVFSSFTIIKQGQVQCYISDKKILDMLRFETRLAFDKFLDEFD